jgi:predicted RNase H-like nuclease
VLPQDVEMYFVGIDLAWGTTNQTGIAAIDEDGRLVRVTAAVTDDEIVHSIELYTRGECLVAIDAPLVVTNPAGSRTAEKDLNRHFARFEAGAQPANTGNPLFDPPRAAVLADRLALDVDPTSASHRKAIEVYPHPATISLFHLDRTLKYKRRNRDPLSRKDELQRLITNIESLQQHSPQLLLSESRDWIALKGRADAAVRSFELNACEDPIDAVLCAYIAMFVHLRPHDVTTYGAFPDGYIVTPTVPADLAARPRAARQPSTRQNDDRLRRVRRRDLG